MQLGTYEVLESLGKGSFGEVFLAKGSSGPDQGRKVAVRRLRDTVVADPAQVERLASTAKVLSTLRHPNIAQIHGFVRAAEGHLIVMEPLEGVELRRLIQVLRRRKRLLHPGISLDLAVQLCHGLHYAHVATDPDGNPLGLVHREIKPGSLMITRDGQLKIMDFGVAPSGTTRTRTGGMGGKGSLQYMAPEQAAGLAIDARVDQFATGLILAELLLGHPVYQSPNDASLYFQVGTAAVGPALDELREHYPRVASVAERALALVPEDRYPNQLEMAEALLEILPEYQPAPALAGLVSAVLDYETDLSAWSIETPQDLLPRTSDETEGDRLHTIAPRLDRTTGPNPGDEAKRVPQVTPDAPTVIAKAHRASGDPDPADTPTVTASAPRTRHPREHRRETEATARSTGSGRQAVNPDTVPTTPLIRARRDSYGDEVTMPGVPLSVISVTPESPKTSEGAGGREAEADGERGAPKETGEAERSPTAPGPEAAARATRTSDPARAPEVEAGIETRREQATRKADDPGPGPAMLSPPEGRPESNLEDATTVVVRAPARNREAPAAQDHDQQHRTAATEALAVAPASSSLPSTISTSTRATGPDPGKPGDGEEDAWFERFEDNATAPVPDDLEAAATGGLFHEVAESPVVRFLFGLLVVLAVGVPIVLLWPRLNQGSGVSDPDTGHLDSVVASNLAHRDGAGDEGKPTIPGREPPGPTPANPAATDSGLSAVASTPVPSRDTSVPIRAPEAANTEPVPKGTDRGGPPGAASSAERKAQADSPPATSSKTLQPGVRHPPRKVGGGKPVRRAHPTEATAASGVEPGTRLGEKQTGSKSSTAAGGGKTTNIPSQAPSQQVASSSTSAPSRGVSTPRGTVVSRPPDTPPPDSLTDMSRAGDPVSKGARTDSEPTDATSIAPATLVLRVIPGDSLVRLRGVDVRDACWDGCQVNPGKQVIEVVHPDGRSRKFSLTLPAGGTRRCLYRFDLSEPLQCR